MRGKTVWSNYRPKATMFFSTFRWARALDLGRVLQKKHVFSAHRAHWIFADFRKKTFNLGG